MIKSTLTFQLDARKNDCFRFFAEVIKFRQKYRVFRQEYFIGKVSYIYKYKYKYNIFVYLFIKASYTFISLFNKFNGKLVLTVERDNMA